MHEWKASVVVNLLDSSLVGSVIIIRGLQTSTDRRNIGAAVSRGV